MVATSSNPSGSTRWFAFTLLRFGRTDRASGAPANCGWADYGFDLDGRATSLDDSLNGTNTCSRLPTSGRGVLTDGADGIDNNFGHALYPLFCMSDRPVDARVTLLLRIDDVGGDDDVSAPGAMFLARDLGHAPNFDVTDRWAIDPRSLTDATSMDRPVATFPRGYVAHGVWVSGPSAGRVLVPTFPSSIFSPCAESPPGVAVPEVDMPMRPEQVAVRLADGGDGVLAGVLSPGPLSASLQRWLEPFGLCPNSSTYEQVMLTIEQASDLVEEAPNLNDPSRQCDAISFGMGFTMKPCGPPRGVAVLQGDPPSACTAGDVGPDADAEVESGDASPGDGDAPG
jgi:hypothetical protein